MSKTLSEMKREMELDSEEYVPCGQAESIGFSFTKGWVKPKHQVGGSHYQMAIEPIEYIEANRLGFHEGNVIKYVSRYKEKNGLEDLEKAKWYIERLIETYQG